MKITDVNKDLTYYVDTDKEDFPYYRTDVDGRRWENLMGDSWEPVCNPDEERKLQELFLEWKRKLIEGRDIKRYGEMINPSPECPIDGCRFLSRGGYSTPAHYAPVYDKDGVNTSLDRNITTFTIECLTCGKRLKCKTQFVDAIYSYLKEDSKELEGGCKKVLYDNLWDLYGEVK